MDGAQKQRSEGRLTAVHAAPVLHREPSPYGLVKAIVEWVGALVLLLAALPLMGAVAATLVCTSRGPVIYSQMRLGRRGKAFRIYKFRSMAHDCEAATGPVWSIAGDPRATTFGRWLRATHVDELPQLWNVLKGEMSLIGPRPERPEIAEQIERIMPGFSGRLVVRPGLSGLAQVLLPPDADFQTVRFKLAHDLHYIRTIGPLVDLRIALATALQLFGVNGPVVRGIVGALAEKVAPESVPVSEPSLRLAAPSLRLTIPVGASAPTELSKAA